MSANNDIAKLDELIASTIDSIKGYEHSADHADAARYESLFRNLADERRTIVASLQTRSRELGGTPSDFGSAAATIHLRFQDLRRALGGGDAVLIKEIVRGEEYLAEEYQRVIADEVIAQDTRTIAARCYEQVRSGRDLISQLEHQLEPAS